MTIKTIAAITFGNALGGSLYWSYQAWRAKRTRITMVRNRKGIYVDRLTIYERWAWAGYWVMVVSIVALGVILLS